MNYFDELTNAMVMLAEDPRSIFMGQAVAFPGTAIFNTLHNVPMGKRLELPVFENTQLGMAIGMSLDGLLPICIYPRINFLLEAMSQLVQHLDKLPLYSKYQPKVIIRTAVATPEPLDPGPQHLGDYSNAIQGMLTTIPVVKLYRTQDIMPGYRGALERDGSTLLVEYTRNYQ